jgi:aminoglycoside 6'-N-acetyltransferase I
MDRADHLGEPVITLGVATEADAADWARMRLALWPRDDVAEHAADIAEVLAGPGETLNLIARSADRAPAGFAEASLRHDYVNGTKTSPVAFLEGIYVEPGFRASGVARQLVAAIEVWARQMGCSELASDAPITNMASQRMHDALGFAETQRVVYFLKVLD